MVFIPGLRILWRGARFREGPQSMTVPPAGSSEHDRIQAKLARLHYNCAPMPKITFLGAAGTVTGSKYLIEAAGKRLLVDCGLFQGEKELRLRNWNPLPVPPSSINWVLLTHAHIDHTGYLPRLVRDGFKGPIFANGATVELCDILLPDSAHLQEEDAKYAAMTSS